MKTSGRFAFAALVACSAIGLLLVAPGMLIGQIVHPLAQPRYDQGPVEATFRLGYIQMMFQQTAAQRADLGRLLAEQHDPASPEYHNWLTPEQYGDRFGLNAVDLMRVTAWLASAGFTIEYTARGKDWIAFSGTAAQVQTAFHASVHWYAIRGDTHFAVATEPSIPPELKPLVATLLGLNDFRPKSMAKRPAYTSGLVPSLAPGDLATIYDINPLYQHGLNGSGQRIVIVGQALGDASLLSDVQQFRTNYGLAPANIQVFTDGTSPTNTQDDRQEADLDLEWAGAIAPNATLVYLYGGNNEGNLPLKAIDQDLAPVISESLAVCEANVEGSLPSQFEAQAQKGNTLGITWIAASGDTGAAACDEGVTVASHAPAVNFPASVPEITAVGGSEFNEGTGLYWSLVNGPHGGSALGYIPEMAWNDTVFGTGLASNGELSATGGGMSNFFLRLLWQAGLGSTYGTGRYVPDIALAASPNHDPYNIIAAGQSIQIGGTSAATPVFAGMLALLNQHLQENGAGNINWTLYAATSLPMFHDIVVGSNTVPCLFGVAPVANCPGTGYGYGFNAGPGYDLATGLGSVDAFNLITGWIGPPSNVVPSCSPNPVYEQQPNAQGYSWFYTITLTETAGVATSLTGFTFNGTDVSSQIASYFGGSTIPAFGSISADLESTSLLAPGTIVFGFTGVDAGGRQWSQRLSVPFNGAQTASTISLSNTLLQFSYTLEGLVPPPQAVTVSNSGGGTLTWSPSSNVSWLNLSSAASTLTVSVNPTGLTSGPYNGVVAVTAAGAANSPQTISVALTVNPGSSTTSTTRVLPDFAVGSSFVSDFYVVNSGTSAGNFSISFHDDLGHPIMVPFAGGLGNISTLSGSIPAGGAGFYEAGTPQGASLSGSALITSDPAITVQALFRRLAGGEFYEAAVPSASGSTEVQVPFDATTLTANGAQIYTGLAIANLDASNAANISCTARDSGGTVIPNAIPAQVLNPLGHWANYLFPALDGKRGTLDCSANTQIGAIGIRALGTDALSTLPIITIPISNASGMKVLPDFAVGASFVSDFYVVNSGTTSANFSISFHDDLGNPIAVPFAGGLGNLSTLSGSIPAGGAGFYEAGTPQGTGLSGSAMITSDPSVTIQALFRRLADGEYYEAAVPVSSGSNEVQVLFDATTFSGNGTQIYTGLAIANLDTSNAASVSCTARDSEGNIIPDAIPAQSLNPLGHWANYVFPALTGKRGTLDCTSNTQIGAIGIRALGTNALSSLPVIMQ